MHLAYELHCYRNHPNGYFPISSRELARAIGRDFASSALEEVLKLGLLETDAHFIRGQKCRGYRFPSWMLTLPVERVLIHGQVARRIAAYKAQLIREGAMSCPIRNRLWESLKTLVIECGAAGDLMAVDSSAFNPAVLMMIDKIARRDFFFSYDRRTGRVFNSFTNLPKVLRQRARLGGEALVEIDVKSSQPVLLNTAS